MNNLGQRLFQPKRNIKLKYIFSFLLLMIFLTNFSFAQVVIYSENFNGELDTYPLHAPGTGSSTWTATYISGSTGISTDSRWAIYQPAGTASKLLEMYVSSTDKVYLVTKACNTVAFDRDLVNASCFTNLTLSYDWAAGGEAGNTNDHLIPVYSTDNGATWTNLGAAQHHNSAAYPALQNVTNLDISALDGQVFNIGFRWVNNNATGTNNGPLVDNIVIRGVQPACSGTPAIGTASINYSEGCSGKAVELVLNSNTGTSCTSGITYQWQSSANGTTGWANIGQTNPQSAATTSTSTIYYRLTSTCSNSGISANSNVVDYTAVACTDYPLNASTNGTTVNTCLGMFYDNNVSGNYANSQTRTITFCSGTSEHVMADFFLFETESNGQYGVNQVRIDILNVYDGNSTAAPQLFSLSGGSDPNEGEAPIIISSGSCLTFQFTSNGSTVDVGWEAMISCTDEQNNIASNYCATAPFICNLNGYQGSTTNFYNPNTAGGTLCSGCSDFDGTLDNNSFITFKPTSTSVTFQLDVFNCTGGITSTSGFYEAIQFGVYSQGGGGSCDIGPRISDYYDIYDGITEGSYTKTLTGLTIGATYYIVVDGLWGTVCDYSIDVISGITLPTIDVNQAVICSGNNVTITASGGSSYVWSTGATTPSITVSAEDVYTVEVVSGNPSCPDNTLLSSNIIVNTCLPVSLIQFSGRCLETSDRILEWSTASENNSDFFAIEKSIDGVNWNLIGQVTASNYSNSLKNYSYYDQSRENGTFFYRLKQYDFNGVYDLYNAIAVDCDAESNEFYLYPNPANSFVYLEVPTGYKAKNLSVLFYNVQGKLVQTNEFDNANMKKSIDVSGLARGCYLVHIKDSFENFETIRFIKD